MRAITYWACVAVIAIPSIYGIIAGSLPLFGLSIPYHSLLTLIFSSSSLVPGMFGSLVPLPILIVLKYVMVFLLVRRAWLFAVKRERVPHAFRNFQKVLGYLGICSLFIATLLVIANIELNVGFGVPVILFFMPAMFFIPWAFFITEILSFKQVTVNHEPLHCGQSCSLRSLNAAR